MKKYDIAIIGGGPGGYTAAIRAAQLGASVCLVEKNKVGGTCLNWGCIPTKALLSCTHVLSYIKRAEEFGLEVEGIKANWPRMVERKDKVVAKLVSGIEFLLKSYNVELIQGRASLAGKDLIEIEETNGGEIQLSASHIILATGSRPAYLPAFDIDGKQVITSNEALGLTELPESLIIVGGGVIGSEFACIFSELGVKITIVEALDRILNTEDRQISQRMRGIFKKRGITIHTNAKITGIKKTPQQVTAMLESGEEITAQKVLVSIGRALNTQELGLEETGIELGPRGQIIVNDRMQTNIPNIYAIGDIVGKIMLAHVATRQGMVAVGNIMGSPEVMDYGVVPSTIFTQPEIASVGLTADKAKQAGHEVKLGNFSFMALGKAVAMGEAEGTIRIVADAKTDKLLGAQIMGPHATDLIAEVALGISQGSTAADIARTIHAHPTLAEAIFEAAEDVHGKAIHVAKRK
jgi:dihydrolipoamide dehydrogenase